MRILFASFIEKTDIPSSSKVNSSLISFDPNLIYFVIILLLSESMITQILIIFYYCICLHDPGAEIMEGCCMDLLSLKEFLDLFAHVPCSFFGEGERKYPGEVDAFFFDHVRDLCGDGRGLASGLRLRGSSGGLGMVNG